MNISFNYISSPFDLYCLLVILHFLLDAEHVYNQPLSLLAVLNSLSLLFILVSSPPFVCIYAHPSHLGFK